MRPWAFRVDRSLHFTAISHTTTATTLCIAAGFISDDDDDNLLRSAAYETIGELINAAPVDCRPCIDAFVPKFLERLQATFSPDFDKEQQNQLQTALCCTLENSLNVLGAEYRPYINPTIQLLFSIFQSKTNTVHEEALSLFGALIQRMLLCASKHARK